MIANGEKRALVATYPYHDEDGALLSESLRYDHPKDFRQRRPNGHGGHVWNLNGVRRVPYRLRELLNGIEDGKDIYVVEGEKDVDTLIERGFCATTNAGGCTWKWTDSFVEHFRAAKSNRVIVIPDCDEADEKARRKGREAARDNAALLRSVVDDVRILDLAPERHDGYDVTDWFGDGHTDKELRAFVDSAPSIDVVTRSKSASSKNGKPHDVSPPTIDATTPEDSREPVDLAALLNEVVLFIRCYVVASKHQVTTLALWVAHTHAFAAAETTPYMTIVSTAMRSGKTRLLEVLELLVRNPWMTARATAAALVRKVDKDEPTLLFDELDATFKGEKEKAEATRGILNSGYNVEGRATVCFGQGANIETRDLRTFCPKALAGIGKLPDTVRDRSVIIELQRKIAGEEASRFRRKRVKPRVEPIRTALAAWGSTAIGVLAEAEPADIDGISDRAADCWEPLLAIAELAGGEWPERARNAAIELSGDGSLAAEDSPRAIRLVTDIRDVFDSCGEDRLASARLAGELAKIEDSLWEPNQGKAFDARALARELRPWHIRPKTIRVDDETTKGYMRDVFEDAWRRYAPGKPPSNRNNRNKPYSTGFFDGFSTVTDGSGYGNENGEKPLYSNDVTDVTDKWAPDGPEARSGAENARATDSEVSELNGPIHEDDAQTETGDGGLDL